ncbi:MAG: hypothetical protein NZ703_03225 [Gemmataceae bacterium]|nr:hypothetical protein [Gemmataceae bacterium]MCS7270075.1 hypothetical protein [Gemmataceae bacterium]MDW8241939.1 hypothetical protein [Thermogemmata sp.]
MKPSAIVKPIGTLAAWGSFTVALLTLATLAVKGQPPSPVVSPPGTISDAATFDRLLVDTLRDVHNLGADLYNTQRDYAGAYRLYLGALLAVRPLLAHRPAIQQRLERGLQEVEREPTDAHKAFYLHVVIEDIRGELKKTAARPGSPTPSKDKEVPTHPTPMSEKTPLPDNKPPATSVPLPSDPPKNKPPLSTDPSWPVAPPPRPLKN